MKKIPLFRILNIEYWICSLIPNYRTAIYALHNPARVSKITFKKWQYVIYEHLRVKKENKMSGLIISNIAFFKNSKYWKQYFQPLYLNNPRWKVRFVIFLCSDNSVWRHIEIYYNVDTGYRVCKSGKHDTRMLI